MPTTGRWRKAAFICGCVALVVAIVLHFFFWARAQALHGFWGHLDEAARWFQAIDVASLFAIALCLFGSGWKRWICASIGAASFVLRCIYAMGL
jgi:hypothetical protein